MENENKETVENENKVEETGNEVTQTSNEKTEEKAEKTLTQTEVNALLKKEKEKYEKKYKDVDIEEYRKYKESQKTAEQKQSEKEAEYQKTLSKNTELENENKVLKSGVNADDADYVLFKVSKMDGDFEENLGKFLKDNPKYLNSSKEERKDTGSPVQGLNEKPSGVLEILAQKHPDIKF